MTPPDTTPAELLTLADRLNNALVSSNPQDLVDTVLEATATLRSMAAPPPPAPQDWKGGGIQHMCDGCKTATHCAHVKRCLAECVPTDLASPALDHEALVTRLTALADALHKSADVLRAFNISESTIARVAGNLLSGYVEVDPERRREAVVRAVTMAREIVAQVQATKPGVGR